MRLVRIDHAIVNLDTLVAIDMSPALIQNYGSGFVAVATFGYTQIALTYNGLQRILEATGVDSKQPIPEQHA
jgi:hypothetical protein